jgi:hypothetical protein
MAARLAWVITGPRRRPGRGYPGPARPSARRCRPARMRRSRRSTLPGAAGRSRRRSTGSRAVVRARAGRGSATVRSWAIAVRIRWSLADRDMDGSARIRQRPACGQDCEAGPGDSRQVLRPGVSTTRSMPAQDHAQDDHRGEHDARSLIATRLGTVSGRIPQFPRRVPSPLLPDASRLPGRVTTRRGKPGADPTAPGRGSGGPHADR